MVKRWQYNAIRWGWRAPLGLIAVALMYSFLFVVRLGRGRKFAHDIGLELSDAIQDVSKSDEFRARMHRLKARDLERSQSGVKS
jgi:hypothetical protein